MEAAEFKELRHAAGLTQEQTAALLGMTLRTISRWEQGETHIGALESEEIRRRLIERAEATAKRVQ